MFYFYFIYSFVRWLWSNFCVRRLNLILFTLHYITISSSLIMPDAEIRLKWVRWIWYNNFVFILAVSVPAWNLKHLFLKYWGSSIDYEPSSKIYWGGWGLAVYWSLHIWSPPTQLPGYSNKHVNKTFIIIIIIVPPIAPFLPIQFTSIPSKSLLPCFPRKVSPS